MTIQFHCLAVMTPLNDSRSMSEKSQWLNLLREWMDPILPIQACSSEEEGCAGIWTGCPSVLDCKVVHIYSPRSRPEERARTVTAIKLPMWTFQIEPLQHCVFVFCLYCSLLLLLSKPYHQSSIQCSPQQFLFLDSTGWNSWASAI